MYIYIYIERERERDGHPAIQPSSHLAIQASMHPGIQACRQLSRHPAIFISILGLPRRLRSSWRRWRRWRSGPPNTNT